METQQQKISPNSDKPSFFGMPRGARIWAQAGRRFWAGALFGFLNGIGLGLLVGAAMVTEWALIDPESDLRLVGIALVLLMVSVFWAQWAIGRNKRPEAG